MSAVVVSNTAPFGAMMNEAVAELLDANAKIQRVAEAITVAGGYQAGSPAGSAFEISNLSTVTNNFGVVAGSSAGANGSAWAYAAANLAIALAAFLTTNAGGIGQLDNGTPAP